MWKKSGGEEKLRKVWRQMHRRCEVPTDDRYKSYGARGIKVCPEWFAYEPFRTWALANGYGPGLSIDRVDNDGDYCPENCQWSTRASQMNNRSDNRWLEAYGERKTLSEWSQDPRCAVSRAALWLRVQRRGWEVERALSTPVIKNNGEATHCPQGHPYTPDNIYWVGPDRAWRRCRTCLLRRTAERDRKRRGKS